MDGALSLEFERLGPDDKFRVNRICEQFEESLRRAEPVRAEDHLSGSAAHLRSLLLRELLLLECEYRFRRLEPVSIDDIVSRLSGNVASAGELIAAARTSAQAYLMQDKSPDQGDIKSWLQASARFRIRGVLGQGGFAVVFRADAPHLGGEVAIKAPLPELLFSEELRQRFLRESEAASRLDHPHIVRVLETGQAGPVCYLVAAYVPGPNLAEWLREQPAPMSVRSAVEFVKKLALATHYAHQTGVLHCDLKPANVVLDTTGSDSPNHKSGGDKGSDRASFDLASVTPKITDFGLARFAGEASHLSQSGMILGTPLYMAPEQIQSGTKHLAPMTDVYSLGVILYELLTKKTPCSSGPVYEVLYHVVHDDPPSPKRHQPRVPSKLETICLKCLEKDPAKRYPTAQELAKDLDHFLQGGPIKARRPNPIERTRRWCRRHRALPVAGTITMLAILGALSGFAWQRHTAEAARRTMEAAIGQTDAAQHEAEESARASQEAFQQLANLSQSRSFLMDPEHVFASIELLRRSENYFNQQLDRDPGNTQVRHAVAHFNDALAGAYCTAEKIPEAEKCYLAAERLLEPLARQDPGNRSHRILLASVNNHHCLMLATHPLGEYKRNLEYFWRAFELYQELFHEDAANIESLGNFVECQLNEMQLARMSTFRAMAKTELPKYLHKLRSGLYQDPSNDALRARQAFATFLLAEIEHGEDMHQEAANHWRQAHQLLMLLGRVPTDHCMTDLLLGLSCCRMMSDRSDDPHYREATQLLEKLSNHLASVLDRAPETNGLCRAYSQSQRCLIVCHWKAGNGIKGSIVHKAFLQFLTTHIEKHPRNAPLFSLLLEAPLDTAQALRDANQPAAALSVTREAAAEMSRLASLHSVPSYDFHSKEEVAASLLAVSALLCQLDDPLSSLRYAEEGRRRYGGLCRDVPNLPRCFAGLSYACERIGKAYSKLGQYDKALVAFQDAAGATRRRLELSPSSGGNRIALSRCHGRLAEAYIRLNNRIAAAEALREQENLCSDNARELLKVTHGYNELAKKMTECKKHLSPDELGEQSRYVEESERVARKAESLARETQ